jgi:hypothetical protein
MDINGFLEVGGYFVNVTPHNEHTGRWVSWVRFERASDFTEKKTTIPGIRMRVPHDFPTQEKSVEAGYEYARQLVDAGDVDL